MRSALLLFVSLFLIYSVASDVASVDATQERATYCEMVKMYKNTGGDYGWPDYNNSFADCEG